MKNDALVLLSGGLDSCVATAVAKEEGLNPVLALNVFYGQRHAREEDSFYLVANHYGLKVALVDISSLAESIKHGSALLNKDEELPTDRAMSAMTARVPRTYVPGRNTIFLALAQSIAEANGIGNIVVGANAVDFSGYPDCRPIFVSAWNNLARYATKAGYEENKPIEVVAPIINMGKASVVYHGRRLSAPLELTWSCYAGGKKACGRCDSCIIRWNAFVANGLVDPIEYEFEPEKVGM
jgi:7-cyano-7-deazaguanine synthase